MISTIKGIIKNIIFKYITQPSVPASYSQAGEDAVLRFLFNDYGKPDITYLDIGTNTPIEGNNTYLFYQAGNKGVCVEADSSLIDGIRSARPADTVIHAGISVSGDDYADFYVFNLSAINTFDKDEAKQRSESGLFKIIRVDKVPLININKIIEDHFQDYPDLISIDIEGLDLAVLQSLDLSKYKIPVICVETCQYSETHVRPKDYTIEEYLLAHQYDKYADTYINTIFVYKPWFYKMK